MATKRTGRPRGRPKGDFLSDPDRHIIGMVEGLAQVIHPKPKPKLEHLIAFALFFHNGDRIELPPCPAAMARRLKLKPDTVIRLEAGYQLEKWASLVLEERGAWTGKPAIRHEVNRVRQKMKRIAQDPQAQRWCWYMRNAWACLLSDPRVAPVLGWTTEAGERAYLKAVMVPFAKEWLPELAAAAAE